MGISNQLSEAANHNSAWHLSPLADPGPAIQFALLSFLFSIASLASDSVKMLSHIASVSAPTIKCGYKLIAALRC